MKLTVVGGFYVERCIQPLWDAAFGSGGRAAAAAVGIVPDIVLHAYVPDKVADDANALAEFSGFKLQPHKGSYSVEFDYLHPLATPRISPSPERMKPHPPILVDGEFVLRFGMLEGDAIVHADIAVYDPQSAFGAKGFTDNGSTAKRLAYVLNRSEAHSITGHHDHEKAAEWLIREGAEVVVVKMGGHGAYVASQDSTQFVPLYGSERVWKIGSGDVFSAAFAAFWGDQGLDAVVAADLASRATAMYCDSRSLPFVGREDLEQADLQPIKAGKGRIYLAGPFFDIAQRWLVEEACTIFRDLGAEVFSPVHDVGPGPGKIVAPEDIKGLEEADVVFAILNGLDAGTVFEVGYAVSLGKPVVALAQNIRYEDLKMVVGTGCEVSDDFTSAIYRAIWRLPQT